MKLLSGGQTGIDRAALDVALALGIPCGGWCPRGRKAEDGVIPDRYPLTETTFPEYAQRTALNVRDSDGTLILTRGEPSGGTALTIDIARQRKKPCFVVDLDDRPDVSAVQRWLQEQNIQILNVAGPRESQSPGIGAAAALFLQQILPGCC